MVLNPQGLSEDLWAFVVSYCTQRGTSQSLKFGTFFTYAFYEITNRKRMIQE